jgi:NADPH-dependent curcumin reductase CurA
MAITNTRVVLAKRPDDMATPDCFSLETQTLGALTDNQVRVAVEYVSVDAGTRTMLQGEGFHQQVGVGQTVLAGGVGRVIDATAPGWVVGQPVVGGLGVQTFATLSPEQIQALPESGLPIRTHLGALGASTGITAWIGVRRVAQPQPGEIFVVSAAAGAVGSLVGQIAKRDGAHVIGIAGGPRKTEYLVNQLGFDEAIDYKNEGVSARLKSLAPEGVNVFFDNVGGPVLDAVLDNIAMQGRVIICGAVSQYNHMDKVIGPSMYLRLAERQAKMEGFAFFHFPESIEPAAAELTQWLQDGELTMPEEILDGIECYPEALAFMFSGGNLGKLLVKIS